MSRPDVFLMKTVTNLSLEQLNWDNHVASICICDPYFYLCCLCLSPIWYCPGQKVLWPGGGQISKPKWCAYWNMYWEDYSSPVHVCLFANLLSTVLICSFDFVAASKSCISIILWCIYYWSRLVVIAYLLEEQFCHIISLMQTRRHKFSETLCWTN